MIMFAPLPKKLYHIHNCVKIVGFRTLLSQITGVQNTYQGKW